MNDHWGSDYDYDTMMGNGEPPRYCEHGVNLDAADCGVCSADDIAATNRELTADECAEAFAQFFRQTLDKIDGGHR